MLTKGARLGRFEIGDELGNGTYGSVYAAVDVELNQRVALKVLNATFARESKVRERFKREIVLARRVVHGNVCRVFDLHSDGDALFLSMEMLRGRTLLSLLRAGPMEQARAIHVLCGVCDGLQAAHAVGVIHRDLKPANIMVRDDTGDAVICDFGTAVADDVTRLTRPGTPVGSLRFMAPELLEGDEATIASDIYALGMVAYATFTGRLPYDAANSPSELAIQMRKPAARIDVVTPSVPRALADVVARSISRDPSVRFESASAMRDALLAAADARDTIAIPADALAVEGPPSRPPVAMEGRPSRPPELSDERTLPLPPPRAEREREQTMSTFDARAPRVSGVVWGVMTIVAILIGLIVFVLTR